MTMLRTALLLSALLALPVHAVTNAGDDTGTDDPPTPESADPGFANMGVYKNHGAIYLRNNWVLSAWHIIDNNPFGAYDVDFDGNVLAGIPGSEVRLSTPPSTPSDLGIFKVQGDPNLPELTITSSAPAPGTPVTLIGHGRNFGATRL